MKVLLAYPNKLVGDGMNCLLSSAVGVESITVCYDAEGAIVQAETYEPDVIAISSALFAEDKDSYFRQLRQACPGANILVISPSPSRAEFLWTMESGVSGYISLDLTGTQFVEAVTKVAAGEVVLSGVDHKATIEESDPERDQQARRLSNLTPREKEILALLSHGFSNRQIAEDLFVSEHTVRTHVQNLRSKLNVRSKFQAAMLLMQATTVPGTPVSNGMRL